MDLLHNFKREASNPSSISSSSITQPSVGQHVSIDGAPRASLLIGLMREAMEQKWDKTPSVHADLPIHKTARLQMAHEHLQLVAT